MQKKESRMPKETFLHYYYILNNILFDRVSTLQQEANRVPELIKQLQHLQQNVDFLSNQLGEAEDTITQTSIQLEESKKQEHLQKNRYIRDLDMIVRCSGLIQVFNIGKFINFC